MKAILVVLAAFYAAMSKMFGTKEQLQGLKAELATGDINNKYDVNIYGAETDTGGKVLGVDIGGARVLGHGALVNVRPADMVGAAKTLTLGDGALIMATSDELIDFRASPALTLEDQAVDIGSLVPRPAFSQEIFKDYVNLRAEPAHLAKITSNAKTWAWAATAGVNLANKLRVSVGTFIANVRHAAVEQFNVNQTYLGAATS